MRSLYTVSKILLILGCLPLEIPSPVVQIAFNPSVTSFSIIASYTEGCLFYACFGYLSDSTRLRHYILPYFEAYIVAEKKFPKLNNRIGARIAVFYLLFIAFTYAILCLQPRL